MVDYSLPARDGPADPAGTARVFAALGDPTRTAIISSLAGGDRTAAGLAAEFPISLQGTLKHVAVLERAGLVRRSKSGRTVTLHLERDRLESAELWLQQTRLFWTQQLGRLAATFEEQS